jgi:hypothetical protein
MALLFFGSLQQATALAVAADITRQHQAKRAIQAQLEEWRRWHGALLGHKPRIVEFKHGVIDLRAWLGQPPLNGSVEDDGISEGSR